MLEEKLRFTMQYILATAYREHSGMLSSVACYELISVLASGLLAFPWAAWGGGHLWIVRIGFLGQIGIPNYFQRPTCLAPGRGGAHDYAQQRT